MLEFNTNPNIVKTENFFRANEKAYLVREYVEGQTLRQTVEHGGRIPLDDLLNRLSQIIVLLEQLHTPMRDINGQIIRKPLIHFGNPIGNLP